MPPRTWNTLFKQGSVFLLFAAFVLCGFFTYRDAQADDLASSYIGCRLVATGNASHLYAYDPEDFASVGDKAWEEAADQGGFTSFQHPYVQTPLWAYILRPVCGGQFAAFRHLFAGAALLAFAGCFWLTARFWAPSFLSPLAMGIALLCLWFSEPFRYAMLLVQTHVIFLLLTLASLILAERRRPGWAGLLLACAAAVKVTPAVLAVYWLLTRRWKAAAIMALWSAAVTAVTIATTGWSLFTVYLADLHRISRVMLLAFNNQSLTAWAMGHFYPGEVNQFNIMPLPTFVSLGSTALLLTLTVTGGLLDRRRLSDPATDQRPFGAMIALIAVTLCAPIAWTHYSIVLIAPLMLLWHEGRAGRSLWIMASVVAMVALNLRPLATNMEEGIMVHFMLVRSEFYAEVLCSVTLSTVVWPRWTDRTPEEHCPSARSRWCPGHLARMV